MSVENTTAPNFDSIRQINPYGVEYWSARDLMPLLGYGNWRDFNNAIKRAKTACEQSSNNVADHFEGALKPIVGGKGAVQNVANYNLSRFACYLIAQNGDPRKPEIAAAQVYFAIATRENELKQLGDELKKRLELHQELTANYEALAQAAKGAGVMSSDFGKFQDAGYQGLYGGLGEQAIKGRKGIAQEEELPDRMGRVELAANSFKAALTEQKLLAEQVKDGELAIETHHQVGTRIRETIAELGGTMPEELPAEPSVKPLLEERAGGGKGKGLREKSLPPSNSDSDDKPI